MCDLISEACGDEGGERVRTLRFDLAERLLSLLMKREPAGMVLRKRGQDKRQR